MYISACLRDIMQTNTRKLGTRAYVIVRVRVRVRVTLGDFITLLSFQ